MGWIKFILSATLVVAAVIILVMAWMYAMGEVAYG